MQSLGHNDLKSFPQPRLVGPSIVFSLVLFQHIPCSDPSWLGLGFRRRVIRFCNSGWACRRAAFSTLAISHRLCFFASQGFTARYFCKPSLRFLFSPLLASTSLRYDGTT